MVLNLKKEIYDPSYCNNYCGISLINNRLKKLCQRSSILESLYMELIKNLLDQNNLDFLTWEACISLYTSLRIICQRRKFENKDIYLAFWDIKKAYDSVPIFNVLIKIHH